MKKLNPDKGVKDSNVPPAESIAKQPSGFTARIFKDAHDAIVDDLDIPELLKKKIKKPDTDRAR